jgi:hypothetical protein
LGNHLARRGAGAVEGAVQNDVDDALPLVVRDLNNRLVQADAGVVDQNSQPPERLNSRAYRRIGLA